MAEGDVVVERRTPAVAEAAPRVGRRRRCSRGACSEIGARPPEIGARPSEIGARPSEITARRCSKAACHSAHEMWPG